jgi:hypothetical protein
MNANIGSDWCQYVTDGPENSVLHCIKRREHAGDHKPPMNSDNFVLGNFKLVNPVWRVYEPKTEERDMLYGEEA